MGGSSKDIGSLRTEKEHNIFLDQFKLTVFISVTGLRSWTNKLPVL